MISKSKIESVGIKLPDKTMTTADLTKELKLSKPVQIERLTGITSHHVCCENEDSLTLAVEAALDCLKHSVYNVQELEMIISCSISKYLNGLNHIYEPAFSVLIKQKLGNTKAVVFDISNACAGMITGIYMADSFISNGTVKNCLVVSGEYITSLGRNAIQNIDSRIHPEMASLTVGDAGAAVIIDRSGTAGDGFSVLKMVTFSQFSHLCLGHQSNKQPGGVMKTQMKKIHDASMEYAPPFLESALKEAGLRLSDINFVIPHQTAKVSIQAGIKHFERYFNEKTGETIINLEKTGNTASTSHFIALYRYLTENRFKKGDKIMLISFASGLVIGVIIFTINGLLEKYGNNY